MSYEDGRRLTLFLLNDRVVLFGQELPVSFKAQTIIVTMITAILQGAYEGNANCPVIQSFHSD